MRRIVVVLIASCLCAGCGSSPAAPSASPAPAPIPTPAPPSPTPTPAPAPSPTPASTFTITGVVHDGMDGSPLGGVTVTVAGIGLCGHTAPGLVTTATTTDAEGRYSIVVQDNRQLFHIFGGGVEGEARFVRAGFDDLCGVLRVFPVGRNVDVTLPRAGCYIFPNVPGSPIVTRGADFIEFSWRPLDNVRDYLLEVGLFDRVP